MKIKILTITVMAVFSICLCGCKESANNKNVYCKETDYPISFQSKSGGFNYITASETGYYFLDGSFLYYADKENMKPVVVCNRPNCRHEYEKDEFEVWKCNAFFGTGFSNPYIQYYKESLYLVEEFDQITGAKKRNLVKVSLDGAYREKVCELSTFDTFMLHRGYLYKVHNKEVMRREIDNFSDEWEMVFKADFYDVGSIEISAYGNYVYFSVYGLSREDSLYMSKNLYAYNLLSGGCTQIGGKEEGTFIYLEATNAPYLLYKRECVELLLDDPEVFCVFQSELDGSGEKVLYDASADNTEFAPRTCFDGIYYFEDQVNIWQSDEKQAERVFKVRNSDFEIVASCKMDWAPSWYDKCMGDEDYCFIRWQEGDDDGETHTYTYYMKKGDWEDGICHFYLLQESSNDIVVPGVMTGKK